MKKIGVLSLILFIVLSLSLFSTIVFAETSSNQTSEEKAYSCLETRVSGKCSTLPFEDQVFALLALGHKSNIADECKNSLDPSKECWPFPTCKLRETALATIALTNIGVNTQKQIDWLLSKSKSTDKIVWYIQIDTTQNTTCKVKYETTEANVRIASDKKVTISSNRCLKSSNYWLEVDKDCLDKTYEITCAADFITTLLYKSSTSNTIFVSGSLQSASGGGSTQHKIESKCFREGTSTTCDYLGSLWATFALSKARQNINPYLPYLFAFAEENKKTVPYAFLYTFTAEEEYRSKLMYEQKPEGYWEWGSGRGKFYDTAVTLLAFQNEREYSSVLETVKAYLEKVQGKDGCWQNSVKDTGFLAWVLWPKTIILQATQQNCISDYCMTEGECKAVGGNVKTNFYCPGGILKVCCDKLPSLKTCSEMLGVECPADKECSSTPLKSSDIVECCLGTCVPKAPAETECERMEYFCSTSCTENEEEVPEYACNAGEICCKPKLSEESGGGILIRVILGFLLIAIIVLLIIFRNKVQMWYHQIKIKFEKKPPMPPTTAIKKPSYPAYPQYPARPAVTRPTAQAVGRTQTKELDETLRKLKEMTK